MRVAYVSADPGVPIYGNKGCSIHVQEVVRALKTYGAEVDIFAARVGGDPPPGLEDVAVYPLVEQAVGRVLKYKTRPTTGDAAARERAAMRMNRGLMHALRRHGPFDVVYERYSLWGFAGMRFARQQGIPGVLEVNAPLIQEQAEHRTLCDKAAATRIAERSFSAAHTIVAVSAAVAEYVREITGTVARLTVIPNGVDPSRFPLPDIQKPRARGAGFTVGFVGTLKPWHGVSTLVDAFAELHREDPTSRLVVVGDGPMRVEVTQRLDALGLSAVSRLTGAVAPQSIPALLSTMDAAVAPYAARSGFYFSPLKILEYMAAGLPIVASRMGQIEDLISDGETGLLCEPSCVRSLAERLLWLRDAPALRQELGSAARAAVLKDHTWLDVTQRIFARAGFNLREVRC